MAVLVTCFKCGRKLRIHDHLIGRKARCPACKSVFMTEGDPLDPPASAEPEAHIVAPHGSAPPVRRPPPAASPEEEILEGILHETEEEPGEPDYARQVTRRRPSRRFHRGSLQTVRIGMILKGSEAAVRLILILIAIGALIAALATGTFAKKEAESPISDTIVASVAGLVIIVVLLGLTAIVLSLAGNAFCLAAPEKHGAKALAITVLILAVVEVILACLGIIAPSINLATNLFGVIESFLFLFFLRALARCINSRDLEDSVRVAMTLQGSIIGWGIVILVVVFVGIAAGSFDPSVPEGIGGNYLVGSFCCIGIILVFINLVWLIRTLMEARNEIGYYLDRDY